MATLHVFNPDHDYALAVGINVYVSPMKIKRIARQFESLPVYWADSDDFILKTDNTICQVCDSRVFEICEAKSQIDRISPWGWDHSLVMRLGSAGFDERLLPTRENLIEMQRLSHRRISIDLNRELGFRHLPVECFNPEEAMDFLKRKGYAFFKAPWSSSGRGIVNSRRMPEENLLAWIKGIINKQGSVLAERGAEKRMDFASLWECGSEGVEFKGFSITEADDKGQYLGNYCAPQAVITKRISKYTSEDPEKLINTQKAFIEKRIYPGYRGPLGIDMLIDSEGTVWPGIEINLRNTMGHAAMAYQKYLDTCNDGVWEPDPFDIFIPLQ